MRLKRLFVIQGWITWKKCLGTCWVFLKQERDPWQKHLIKRNMQLGRPQTIIGTEDLLLRCSSKSCSVSQKTIATSSSPNSSIPSEDMCNGLSETSCTSGDNHDFSFKLNAQIFRHTVSFCLVNYVDFKPLERFDEVLFFKVGSSSLKFIVGPDVVLNLPDDKKIGKLFLISYNVYSYI